MPPTSSEIRKRFIDFFVARHGHRFYPSSPVVPHDDPTLLFTNAGMNQFKPAFLGQVSAGSPLEGLARAVNSQKCIRAGGKHNDLEDVGKDTYHHTFFEMLGNWSIGDYFKEEAIGWAWEFLTEECGIPEDRLYATYFEGDAGQELGADEEAREIWLKYLPAARVLAGNMKDNFWEMGETGPCGPCSEIHYDRIGGRDAAGLVNQDDPNVLEVWNLVFIQFDRQMGRSGLRADTTTSKAPTQGTSDDPDVGSESRSTQIVAPDVGSESRPTQDASGIGSESRSTQLKPLPARHVDTGMGLERLTSILQNKLSNYDTDLFTPIFDAIQEATGARAYAGKLGEEDEGQVDTAYRVIADHARTLTFAIADGAVPSNEGRGYVLRRVLRRAVRYGRQMLGAETGFLAGLVPVIVEQMGEAFAELRKREKFVREVVLEEEESFGRTLDRGLRVFASYAGDAVFRQFTLKDDTENKYLLALTRETMPAQIERVLDQDDRRPIAMGIDEHSTFTIFERGHDEPFLQFSYAEVTPRLIEHYFESVPRMLGEDVFKLYDTYGFPPDLTQLMAEERGLTVDIEGFERCMAEQRERSRAGGKAGSDRALTMTAEAVESLRQRGIPPTDDSSKYERTAKIATVRAIWTGRDWDNSVHTGTGAAGHPIAMILDHTCFYAESGGQESDTGRIFVVSHESNDPGDGAGSFRVRRADAIGGYVLHVGHVTDGHVRVGDRAEVHVDRDRREPIRANHTMTHVMNFALRDVLGEGVEQKGSLVAPDRLRFDFSHNKPVSAEEIARIEAICREQIGRDLAVYAKVVALEDAKRINGLRAVFGEVYPDPVRVVSVGADIGAMLAAPERDEWRQYSVEFCGGTHLSKTSEAGEFVIVSETGVAKGIRRVEALTGVAARAARAAADVLGERLEEAAKLDDAALKAELSELSSEIDGMTLSVADKERLRARHGKLFAQVKAAEKAAARARAAEAVEQAKKIGAEARDAGARTIVEILGLGGDRQAMQQAMQTIRDACPEAAVMILSVDESARTVAIAAGVPKGLIDDGLKAGDWVRAAAEACGGKGGGKADQAQGGGKDAGKIEAAAEAAREFARDLVA